MKRFIFLSVIITILQTQVVYAGEEINLAAAIGASAIEKPASEEASGASPESKGMDPKTTTLMIVGGVVAVGIIAAISSGGGDSTTSH